MSTTAKLKKAVAPFKRVLAVHDALPAEFNPGDAAPLRDAMAGVWPTVGELRALVKAVNEATKKPPVDHHGSEGEK